MADIEKILAGDQLPIGLDLIEMYRKGIGHLREFSGKYWTDFDMHDPGVTILENLVNSLVDLYFRSSQSIETFFASKGRNFKLPTADEIFPVNPVTETDLRKKILADVAELNNIWVVSETEHSDSFRGIYNLWLDIEEFSNQKYVQEIIYKVKSSFSKHRNLCEDVQDIKVLTPLIIIVNAEIEIDDNRVNEDVYAEILSSLNEFMRPTFKYNAPIADNDLNQKPLRILVSDVIRILKETKGVRAVQNVYLQNNGKRYSDQIVIQAHELPHLSNILNLDENINSIRFSSLGISEKQTDAKIVRRKFNVLQLVKKQQYIKETQIAEQANIPVDLSSYNTIQNDFPELYGIGKMGLRQSDSLSRRASTNQMKAYLLVFEQIMANYLNWISNMNALFMVNEELRPEHFAQPINGIKNLESVVYNSETKIISNYLFEGEKILADYQKGIFQLVEHFVDYTGKQSRFIDFYLATNGEVFNEDILFQHNFYFSLEAYKKQILRYKQRLMYWLPQVNKNRARSYDYLMPQETTVLSGLQIKTALMLGFEAHFGEKITDGFNEPFLADTIYEFGFKFSENIVNDGISPELQNAIDEKIDSNEFDFIDEEEVSKSDFTLDELKEIVQKTFLFENQKITKGMFQYGTDLNNYLCGKIDNKFVLVFLHPINKKWNLIHIFDTEYAANEAAIVFAIYFKKMNIKSEGLYMVEHTLLRPRTTKNFFGIYLLDAKGDKFLYSTNLYTEIERNKILKILKEEIGYYKNYRVERLENGEHQIVFSAADNTIEFLGQNKYTSVQEIYAKLENTFQFLCDKYEIVPFNQKYSMYVQFKKTDDRIEGDFFSHRVSAIMPNWTSRFANPEFRKVAERCIRSLAPAYIGIDFYWISPEQMQRFEKAYMLWKHCFRREKNTVDNVINKRILNYLLQFADSM